MTPRRRTLDKRPPRPDGQTERELVERCLAALERTVPLDKWKCTLLARIAGPMIDARVELWLDGQRHDFVAEVRRGIRAAHVGPLAHRGHGLAQAGENFIVCADRIPDVRGQELREAGVGYLDFGGNAFLRGPGLCVLVAGRPPVVEKAQGALKGTVVRLLGVFLRDPDAGEIIQKELAARAGIALGAVGRARERLEQVHVLTRVDNKRWRVTDREAGLRHFADGWAAVVRPKLHPTQYRRLGAERRGQEIERVLKKQRGDLGCLVGGERAAAMLTQGLRTAHATLHVRQAGRQVLARTLKLASDPVGTITLLDRYGEGDDFGLPRKLTPALAHPLLVWAECLTVPDERVAQVAAQLHERYLEVAP
jgi:hypothetical protein